MSTSKETKDHQVIRHWAEERGGVPAKVKDTGTSNNGGILRIHFPKHSENNDELKAISWNEFFDEFDKHQLNFLYQDEKSDGEKSTFHKFVDSN
ncbi:hypothetical protein GCM10023231_21200 [Olivibacter ginsenosidimutans]|uniref:1,4-alpha-glucan branching enzyme n=1 Tax=Olivibacter ginsenosidimutans TaxID=1176537 RepID=A0ABP9BAM4_9SPHI